MKKEEKETRLEERRENKFNGQRINSLRHYGLSSYHLLGTIPGSQANNLKKKILYPS